MLPAVLSPTVGFSFAPSDSIDGREGGSPITSSTTVCLDGGGSRAPRPGTSPAQLIGAESPLRIVALHNRTGVWTYQLGIMAFVHFVTERNETIEDVYPSFRLVIKK
jgi:hypothetical protein